MLIDEVSIILKAGDGGKGKVAFNPGRYGGPSGGNGGNGGSIFATVTSDLTALSRFARKQFFEGNDGEEGGSNKKSGSHGEEISFEFPIGTTLTDTETGKTIELNDLSKKMLISRGGTGGRGNFEFRSSTNTTPRYAQPGEPGEKKHYHVLLKLIAAFGLIGLPNAGKSSLLNEITAAKAKVASYPFTTLEPNLGVLNGKIIADIPGLIEGASAGKGIGIKFLKHIEKVTLLIHCLPADSADLKKDYKVVRNELKKYDPKLLEKPEIILLTKTDLVDKKILKKWLATFEKLEKQVIAVSIHDWDSVENLKKVLIKYHELSA